MGRLQANEMVANLPEHEALVWHLRYNHYPAIPAAMVEPCRDAIAAASADDWHREIDLPEGVEYHGRSYAPAHAIIEHAHLDAFIGGSDE